MHFVPFGLSSGWEGPLPSPRKPRSRTTRPGRSSSTPIGGRAEFSGEADPTHRVVPAEEHSMAADLSPSSGGWLVGWASFNMAKKRLGTRPRLGADGTTVTEMPILGHFLPTTMQALRALLDPLPKTQTQPAGGHGRSGSPRPTSGPGFWLQDRHCHEHTLCPGGDE